MTRIPRTTLYILILAAVLFAGMLLVPTQANAACCGGQALVGSSCCNVFGCNCSGPCTNYGCSCPPVKSGNVCGACTNTSTCSDGTNCGYCNSPAGCCNSGKNCCSTGANGSIAEANLETCSERPDTSDLGLSTQVPQHPADRFRAIDTNSDGAISLAEATHWIKENTAPGSRREQFETDFATLDENSNGTIEPAEFDADLAHGLD